MKSFSGETMHTTVQETMPFPLFDDSNPKDNKWKSAFIRKNMDITSNVASSVQSNEQSSEENGVPAKKACLESDETAATLDNTGNATINSHPLTLDWKHSSEKYNLLIACTGSVACIKLTELLSEIKKCSSKYEEKLNIRIIATNNALKFFDRDSLNVPVIDDCLEWDCWKGRGDPVIHIELRRWAHMLLIAPLDANTLAKIANGLCDNLVTSVVRAWDFNRPVYFCPAMNTYMWDNPLTVQHLNTLKNLLNFREIPCVEKTLICGDKGYGAMAALPMIASVVASEVKKHFAIYTG